MLHIKNSQASCFFPAFTDMQKSCEQTAVLSAVDFYNPTPLKHRILIPAFLTVAMSALLAPFVDALQVEVAEPGAKSVQIPDLQVDATIDGVPNDAVWQKVQKPSATDCVVLWW